MNFNSVSLTLTGNSPVKPRRSPGLFTDMTLYKDAMEITFEYREISKKQLKLELSRRVKGLVYIAELSNRVLSDLMGELYHFGWVRISKNKNYELTPDGEAFREKIVKGESGYYERLIIELDKLYGVPGRFINRLWELNAEGQGELLIPKPLKSWKPSSRKWEDNDWNNECEFQTGEIWHYIRQVSPKAFPVQLQCWLAIVKKSWERLSQVKPRDIAKPRDRAGLVIKEKMKTYSPRLRLSLAMKEAAVENFFQEEGLALSLRNYMAWCPRLAELGLLFYTDFHPQAPGRYLFPVSVFMRNCSYDSYSKIAEIKNKVGECLFLHRPVPGAHFSGDFTKALYDEYQKTYNRVRSIYVPLMDVRDEVCRRLKLSASQFDNWLESFLKNTGGETGEFSVSIESDIREDQRSGYQILRRPVFISGKSYSLFAMRKV